MTSALRNSGVSGKLKAAPETPVIADLQTGLFRAT